MPDNDNDDPTKLSLDVFLSDSHAAGYLPALAAEPAAAAALLAIINDPLNEHRLRDVEWFNAPALTGVARFLEADPDIRAILEQGPAGYRFRQAVGVAIKLKMAKLGWRPTGRKGLVSRAEFFSKAEHYAQAATDAEMNEAS